MRIMDNFAAYDPRESRQPQQLQEQVQWEGQGQGQERQSQQWQPEWQAMGMRMEPQKNWLATVLLCMFLGRFGVHRFYTGHIVSGIFQLLTGGGFGIWALIDLIMIMSGDFKDQYNRPLDHPQVMGGSRSWATAAFLCLFLGWLGVHRFYTGRVVSGVFQLLTFGGFGIWALVDLIMIFTDSFKDDMGLLLTRLERVESSRYGYGYPAEVKG